MNDQWLTGTQWAMRHCAASINAQARSRLGVFGLFVMPEGVKRG